MKWHRLGILLCSAGAVAAPSPESFLDYRWHHVEILVFAQGNDGVYLLPQAIDAVSSPPLFPSRLVLLQGTVNEVSWLAPDTLVSALNPPWNSPLPGDRRLREDRPDVPEAASAPDWLGSVRWANPITAIDLASVTGMAIPEAQLLFGHLEASASRRRNIGGDSEPEASPTAIELLNAARGGFSEFEAGLIRNAYRWVPGGSRFDRAESRLRKDGLRIVAHGSFHQATSRIGGSPPILMQFGSRLGNGAFEFEGTMNLAQDRYLELHLWLSLNREEERTDGSYLTCSLIQAERRVVSSQTHYFDHPKFGILIGVAPLEVPDELRAILARIDEGVTSDLLP